MMMKNAIFSLVLFAGFFFQEPGKAVAQVPFQFNFQAVARGANGAAIADQSVQFRMRILEESPAGIPIFSETHNAQTNTFGIANLLIGGGTPDFGSLESIDWSEGPYFLQIEIDPTNSNAYQFAGVSPLMSVPYALYAHSSGEGGLEGPAGPPGLSAYEVWLGEGNTGSPEDFLGTLVGPPGAPGDSGSGGNTLQDAYDQGGPGAGRTISAASGPVEITIDLGTTGLEVSSTAANSSAIRANIASQGVALRAESTSAGNEFAAIQANTNSSISDNAAILGNNEGAGYGVAGQIPSTATGSAGVYGSNLRVGGGTGVVGIGFNGLVGTGQGSLGYGVYGVNNNPGNASVPSIGTYGLGFNGVYGQTTNTVQGWAGYFTADLGVEGAGFSTGGWVTVSDRRLKHQVEPISDALNRLLQLNGYRYRLQVPKSGTRHEDGTVDAPSTHAETQYGVVAQEVEQVFPEMVSAKQVFLNQGDDSEYKTVNYDELIPVLIEAIRELNAKVEALERELKK